MHSLEKPHLSSRMLPQLVMTVFDPACWTHIWEYVVHSSSCAASYCKYSPKRQCSVTVASGVTLTHGRLCRSFYVLSFLEFCWPRISKTRWVYEKFVLLVRMRQKLMLVLREVFGAKKTSFVSSSYCWAAFLGFRDVCTLSLDSFVFHSL